MTKVNHIKLTVVGLLFSVVPIYNNVAWIIIYNKYSDFSHMYKVKLLYETTGFNWFEIQSPIPSLISILFGVLAIICLTFSLKNHLGGKIFSLIKMLFLIITSICTFLSLYSLM